MIYDLIGFSSRAKIKEAGGVVSLVAWLIIPAINHIWIAAWSSPSLSSLYIILWHEFCVSDVLVSTTAASQMKYVYMATTVTKGSNASH